MLRRQQPHDNNIFSEDLDEHDQPTEPMPRFIPSDPSSLDEDEQIPAPQPYERPFPRQDAPIFPFPGVASAEPPAVYPYLPPAPQRNGWNRPAGGTPPAVTSGAPAPASRAQKRPRRSPVPFLVRLFLFVVQLLLLARFVLKLISWPASATWVSIIYNISSVFAFPFRLFLQSVAFPPVILNTIELYTLLALFSYWLLSRILGHLLKALLSSR